MKSTTTQETTMTARKTTIAPEFDRAQDFIKRYVILPQDELDIVTVWAMGTWAFSPMATQPATYPYLYVAAPKGSGKTVLGQDVLGSICRMPQATVGITGPGVFRIIGEVDDETGNVVNMAPTLMLDEIDATYSGGKDEPLRQMLNAGYKRGASVPRAFGKTTISFPVYCPKVMMGIDNGHLPDTVTDRSIRIDLHRATPEEMATIEAFYSFDVEDEAAELSQELSSWAIDHTLVLRDYRPEPIQGFAPRQWEIARSLVQLAAEIGIEDRIRAALQRVMTKNPERPTGKVALYRVIFDLFNLHDTDRLTSNQILTALDKEGIQVPGGSGKGLSSVLSEEGIVPDYIRFRADHPGVAELANPVQRGYFRHKFDGAFIRFIEDDDQ